MRSQTSLTILSVMLALLIGLGVGLGAFTFGYGQGWSYLTDDPEACANCHIMRPQYDAWLKSSHRAVAVCNDCHGLDDPLGKYVVKAVNGFAHSWAFTTQDFHEPIQIKGYNLWVAERACRECHAQLWEASSTPAHALDEMSCTRCHQSVGHRD